VGIRNTWYGTHQAEFYGVPASGKQVAVTSVGLDRVTDGKVSEGWGELDMVGMMQQMGALPTVGPGAVAAGKPPVWGPTRSSDADGSGNPQQNKELLLRLIEALGNARELVDADTFVDHSPGWGSDDFALMIARYVELCRAMPDLQFNVDEPNMVAEGNQVAAHSVVRGTHTGEALFGAEPSGNELVWTHTDFVRIAGGRVVERWTASDTLTLFQQAGVLPSHE
jgi:predicted ester cyclase